MSHRLRLAAVFALVLLLTVLLAAGCAFGAARSLAAHAAAQAPVPPPAGDGDVRLWQDAAIFEPVRALLDAAAAGEQVSVEMYEFGRADLATALRAARGRGADVQVVVDETVPESAGTARLLAAAGVPVRAYPVDDRRHQIDHVKLLIAGGEAVVGGMNWGVTSAANHDYAFETTDPAVLDRLRAIFAQDWSLAGGRPAPVPAATGGAVAETTPAQEIRQRLTGEIGDARRSIQAEVFVLTDPDVIAGLASARRRGARVRVLLDPNQAVNQPTYALLRLAGVDVRWYPVPASAKLHAKAALFDGRILLLGSANWSLSGLSVNHELDLVTSDGAAAAAFAARFERDWSAGG